MNIGIDIRPLMSPNRTGVGEYAFALLNAIFSLDDSNQYFLFYNSSTNVKERIPVWNKPNVRYADFHWPNKLFNASLKIFKYPKIDRLIEKKFGLNKLDIFFSPNINFLSLSKKCKHILTIHDLSFQIYPHFFSLKDRLWHKIINPKKLCAQADIILTPSFNTKRDIQEFYSQPSDKIKVIYPGLSPLLVDKNQTDKTILKTKYNIEGRYIFFLGTIEPRKNIIGLIEAFEMAFPSLPYPHSLIIAGAAGYNYNKILKRVNRSPLKDKIKFIGYVEERDKHILYSSADLFVYPSFYEGFGFPILEAMSCGAPVITSNRSSLCEITQNAAWLINPNNPADISYAMVKLLKNDKIRQEFITRGQDAAKLFTWQTAAKEWIKIMRLPPPYEGGE